MPSNTPRPPTPSQTSYAPAARRWLWVGVSSFATIILLLWGWSMKLELTFLSLAKSPEGELISKTKTDWNKIFVENKQKQNDTNTIKKQLRDVIAQIVVSSTLPTEITTSTMSMTTTP